MPKVFLIRKNRHLHGGDAASHKLRSPGQVFRTETPRPAQVSLPTFQSERSSCDDQHSGVRHLVVSHPKYRNDFVGERISADILFPDHVIRRSREGDHQHQDGCNTVRVSVTSKLHIVSSEESKYTKRPKGGDESHLQGNLSTLNATNDKEYLKDKQRHQADDSPQQVSSASIKEDGDKADEISVHGAWENLHCVVCGKMFPHSRLLSRHTRSHDEMKRYQCQFCNKSFSDNFDLKRHVRTHTGVRPFKCELCEKAFTQRCSLESHKRKVHGIVLKYAYKQRREKLYVCEDCGHTTTSIEDHILHVRDNHPISTNVTKFSRKDRGASNQIQTLHPRNRDL
ncbi:transcription factor Ovo-like 2 [Ptychodera flava]|uniref:transcription factor Ovo-like 2 n=1 Tax=Ptychodera flava TaxID=63121 RepID=UPI00396A783A